MIKRDCHHQILGGHFDKVYGGVVLVFGAEGDIELAVFQALDYFGGQSALTVQAVADILVRVSLDKFPHESGDIACPQYPDAADVDGAVSAPCHFQICHTAVQMGQDFLHILEEYFSPPGQNDVAAVFFKQAHIQLLLQCRDGVAEGRLGDGQLFGRLGVVFQMR